MARTPGPGGPAANSLGTTPPTPWASLCASRPEPQLETTPLGHGVWGPTQPGSPDSCGVRPPGAQRVHSGSGPPRAATVGAPTQGASAQRPAGQAQVRHPPAPGPALPLSRSPGTRLPPGHVDREGSDPEQACSQRPRADWPHTPREGQENSSWMVSSVHVGCVQV